MPGGAALSRKISRTLQRLLSHTYTRTIVTSGTGEDAWGDEDLSASVGVSGLPCLYSSQVTQAIYTESFSSDALGARTLRVPTLFVPPDDPVDVGHVVTNVRAGNGSLIAAGPLVVESVTLNAEAGLSVLKTATLHQAIGRATA